MDKFPVVIFLGRISSGSKLPVTSCRHVKSEFFVCIITSIKVNCTRLTSLGKDVNLFLSAFKLFSFFSFPMLFGNVYANKNKVISKLIL